METLWNWLSPRALISYYFYKIKYVLKHVSLCHPALETWSSFVCARDLPQGLAGARQVLSHWDTPSAIVHYFLNWGCKSFLPYEMGDLGFPYLSTGY